MFDRFQSVLIISRRDYNIEPDRSQLLQHFESGSVLQSDVEKHQVGRLLPDRLHRFADRNRRTADRPTRQLLLQLILQHFETERIILDDQNVWHAAKLIRFSFFPGPDGRPSAPTTPLP